MWLCLCMSTITFGEAYTPRNLQKEMPENGVKVHFIQITNGEATLVELENKRFVMIDTGNSSSQIEVEHYLAEQGIKELEYLIISSFEEEFCGNLYWVLDNIGVQRIIYPYALEEDVQAIRQQYPHIQLLAAAKGDIFNLDQDLDIKVLHPNHQLSLSPQNNGLVMQLIHGDNRFLFTGGITEEIELELIKAFDVHSQVLKVSNFGSNQSSHADFLGEVDAHIAIIFHRPELNLDAEVLERLEESWAEVYDIKKHGHIIIYSEKHDYKVFLTPNDFGD